MKSEAIDIMWFFRKKQRALEERAIDLKIAEINKPVKAASKRANASVKKFNAAIEKEDVVFNLYYATHSKGGK